MPVIAPSDWEARVNAASSLGDLDALYAEAVQGGYATRARYLLVQRNQATLNQVNKVMSSYAEKAFAPLEGLSQAGAGGLFRSTVPGLVDQFGNINAQIALDYYDTQRKLAYEAAKNVNASVAKTRVYASGRAQKQLEAQLQLYQRPFQVAAPKFDAIKTSEPIIGYAMKLFQRHGASAAPEVTNAMTRAIAQYNRDTILFNAALDPAVVGVQRVADRNACRFCQMVAFNRQGKVRVTSYAAKYHNHCKCSIEALYAGDQPYKPNYYKDFEFAPSDGADSHSEAFILRNAK